MITTSVIVVNYRTNDMLSRFVESYRNTAPEDSELIVVDVDPIHPFGLKNVPGDYIIIPDNCGYAKACNRASLEAQGVVYAFFNADVELLEGTIKKTSQALLEHDDWGVAGPLQYSSRGKVTHAGIFGTLQTPQHRAWQQLVSDKVRDVKEAVTVSGSAYFVKKQCWLDLINCGIWREMYPDVEGAFLPTFLYYEEEWVSYHARAHEWKVMFYGESEAIHEWHNSIHKYGDKHCVSQSKNMFLGACAAHRIPRYD